MCIRKLRGTRQLRVECEKGRVRVGCFDLYYDLPHLLPLPTERTYRRKVSGWRKTGRPIPSHCISKTRRMILLLPGEKGGLRASVQTMLVPIPLP